MRRLTGVLGSVRARAAIGAALATLGVFAAGGFLVRGAVERDLNRSAVEAAEADALLLAIRVGGGVVMLRIIEIEDQNQQWLGVADLMRAEAEDAANEALDRASGRANGIAAITPERVIREGDPTAQILDVIDKDVDISMLVLAANPGPEGPGPLISMVAQVTGSFPIPVVIVPGDLSDPDIDALS